MANYTSSRVVSLRIDATVLDALRRRARSEGRSVSGQIVFIVREQLEANEDPPRPIKKLSGWLAHRSPPPTLAELRRARKEASQKLDASVRQKARRR